MALLKVNSASLSAVANALRAARSTNSLLTFPTGFVSAIESLASGGGIQLACGVQTIAQTTTFSVNNLAFTPTNALLLLVKRSTTKGVLASAVANPGAMETVVYGSFTNPTSGLITNITANYFNFGPNSATYVTPSTFTIYGTYFYLVWRSEEAQT